MTDAAPLPSAYLPITEFYRYGDSAIVRLFDTDDAQRIRVLRPNTKRFITDNTLWSVLEFEDQYLTRLDENQFAVRVAELGGSLADLYPAVDDPSY